MTKVTEMPARIGRFHIESMLGRGAMGVVYKGHDEHIDRPVAIKLIRADLLDGEERESYFRRFRNEAKIAGRCVHANIVGLYDFSFHEGNPYLVMEYVNGIGLQQALPRGSQRSEGEVLPIALQVLDALQYAHGRGIVHRDVKPANILISPDSKLKITDFGISRLSSTELTMTQLLIGTPSYMSPEQCMGSALDGRSDLFSLGCVLYELLAGHRPFTGANYTDTILGIISRPHTPLQEIRDDLSPGLIAAIDQALAKKPEDRFPSADAFGRALAHMVDGSFRPPALPPVFAELVAMSRDRAAEAQPGTSPDGEGHDPHPPGDDADTIVMDRSSVSLEAPDSGTETRTGDFGGTVTQISDDTLVFPAAESPDTVSLEPVSPEHAPPELASPEPAVDDHVGKDAYAADAYEEDETSRLSPLEAVGAATAEEPAEYGSASSHVPEKEIVAETAASPEVVESLHHAPPPPPPVEDDGHAHGPGHEMPPVVEEAPMEDPTEVGLSHFEPEETLLATHPIQQGIPPQEAVAPISAATIPDAWEGKTAFVEPVQEAAPDTVATEEIPGPADTPSHAHLHESGNWEDWQDWTASCLVRVIGPIGPLVVSRLRNDAHPETLVDECALFIRDANERAFFLRLVSEGPARSKAARREA